MAEKRKKGKGRKRRKEKKRREGIENEEKIAKKTVLI